MTCPLYRSHPAEALSGVTSVLRGEARVDAHSRPPRGPAQRAADRAHELDTLGLAYRLASGVFVESPHLQEARVILVEALKAWERANAPKAWPP